jgi:multicomponent Na+:H+ antiporter subunit D
MASHGVLKITLFFCAGAVYVATHKERVSELDGVGLRMPWTMATFAVAGLLLAGIPPGLAFASKWRLLGGAAQTGAWPAIGVLGASAILNVAYFVPIILRAFLRPGPGGVREAPRTVVVPLLVTVLAGVLLGLWPRPAGLLPLAEVAARGVFAR